MVKNPFLKILSFLILGTLIFVLPAQAREKVSIKVLFLGDSITAGLGVEPNQAYPSLVDEMIKARGIDGVSVINGSISGSTTASGLSRLKWFRRAAPDILVLALGANDGLRGLSTEKMEENLGKTLEFAREQGMDVILAGMEVPPNYGPRYARDFRQVFPTLADKHKILLIPFLLEGVGGVAGMNQADGIHPNPEGHRIIARTVLPFILEEIQRR